MNTFSHSLRAAALAALILPASAGNWITDMDTARKQAADEGKAILANFTGSDWCGYCIRMKNNVLDKPEFSSYAENKFVLLEIDLPRRKQVPAAELQKRQELCRQYEVSGFPTFLILSHTGEVLGGWVGARPSVESTIALLDNALARQQMLKAARALSGAERAKALMEVYESYPKNFKAAAAALRAEIYACDPDDSTGLREQVQADAQMQELAAELSAYARNYQLQTQVYDKYIAKAHPLNRERMMERKRQFVVFPCLNIMLMHAETVEDILKGRDYVLEQAETSYPEHMKAQMIEALKANFADPQALLEQVRARRKK